MKLFKNIWDKILLILTLILLAFIPLYPKLPLINIRNTWVYIRFDDVAVTATILIWVILVLIRRVKLKTPLTVPILLFWVVGVVSTFHGVLILFPMLSNVFPNVALLSFLRRIEYMSLFFVAFSGLKDKKYLNYVVWVLLVTLLAIVVYGFGQKLFGFPAFLTMNEEFAKGIPIRLSQLSRIPSTFGGQYDLAAYLVLVVPIIVSLFFSFKNLMTKTALFIAAASGFALLFTTVSRVSLFAILVSLVLILIFQKKKWVIVSLLAFSLVLLALSPSLLKRFGNTVTPVNVLVDGTTGTALGEVKKVDRNYFKDKIVLTSPSAKVGVATSPATLDFKDIPDNPKILIKPNVSTGESLPQGTGYINLSLSPILSTTNMYFVENPNKSTSTKSADAYSYLGKYLVKRARAYDLSFTTRFQGEWPNTLLAFKRNIFLGSGYGSVSLAVDNDYLRLLGETGILGFLSFLSVFALAGIYIKKTLPKVDSKVARSFVLGFIAGTLGLAINGTLIDVFEASKVAFTYWLLMGICLGTLKLYSGGDRTNLLYHLKRAITSPVSIIAYLLISAVALFSGALSYFFVGDDFTWLKWAAQNQSMPKAIIDYFINANGFFYRPGTMIYFFFMSQSFWLNQTFYHIASIALHFLVTALLFIVLLKILKNYTLSVVSSGLFLLLSVHHEAVLWISSTGFLFNAIFALLALLSFIYWKEKKKTIYFVLSILSTFLSLLFHEVGVVVPLLIISYDVIFWGGYNIKTFFKKSYFLLLSPLLPYLAVRLLAKSHWLSGDYSYNFVKLPFNLVGNALGYFTLDLLGPTSLGFYDKLRTLFRDHLIIAIPFVLMALYAIYVLYEKVYKKQDGEDQKIIAFGFAFFFISLLPFLGLGNIAARYSYLSSVGFVILLAYLSRKVYKYLVNISDVYVGTLSMIIISFAFLSAQLFQLQKTHSDWYGAGEIAKRALVSFQEKYDSRWEQETMHFYFVGVPIKTGDAWVFPVGFKDALWLSLKNKDFTVDMEPDLATAANIAKDVKNSQIFELDANGIVANYIPDVPLYIRNLRNP